MEQLTGIGQKDSQRSVEISPGEEDLVEIFPSVILLVDDDPDIRSLTRTFLEHEGYSVLSSGNAMRALQIFRAAARVDLLITDLYMPGQSGMELAQQLRASRRDLPVLMVSGGLVEEDLTTGLEAEGWVFLAKPFRLTDLLATVHRILAPIEDRRGGSGRREVALGGVERS